MKLKQFPDDAALLLSHSMKQGFHVNGKFSPSVNHESFKISPFRKTQISPFIRTKNCELWLPDAMFCRKIVAAENHSFSKIEVLNHFISKTYFLLDPASFFQELLRNPFRFQFRCEFLAFAHVCNLKSCVLLHRLQQCLTWVL